MSTFPLRKAMRENYPSSTITTSWKTNSNTDNKNNINNTKNATATGRNDFGHGALHRAVINDEEKTIQR